MPAVQGGGAEGPHSEGLRLLTIHAHADDESLTMGGSVALLLDQGVRTALVTCTDGQLATIFDPTMDEATTRPILGEVRRREMAEAARILGLDEFHFLGYRDSGMAGAATNQDAEAFWRHVAGDLETRRVCGLAPIYSLLRTVASGTRGRLRHYEQNVDPDEGSIVSHAALGFYG